MLDSLRSASRSWAAKLLLLLLVVSFAVWGVSASLVSQGSNAVMTVGDQAISPSEFRLAYQRQLATLSRQFGMQLTTEQARALGVESQAYSQLAAGAALDQLSEDMRLGLSQDRLATLIAKDPAFRGNDGRFDRQLFSARLRNASLREEDYIQERSKVAVRSQIVDAVADGFQPPEVLVNALKTYRDQVRDVDYLLLSFANTDPVKAPTEEVLASWFAEKKSRYRAPELRKFAYVTLQPADVADPASVTDEQVRAEYERRKDSYKTAETRTIEQLSFPSKEMAEAALAQMKERQLSFDQLVTDQGKKPEDVMLGDFTRDALPDQAVADAAFALGPQGGVTPVVEGAFGPVVLRVTNVRPETTKTFDEVKDDMRRQLSLSAAAQAVQAVHDRFEDLRGGGASLEEAATQLQLKSAVATVDKSGNDGEGKPVAGLPAAPNLLPEVFRTDTGMEALPVNLGNDGYVWFDVREVIPERDRALSEVHDKAVADWTSEQQRTALAAKAEELKARLDKGETLAAIAGELGLTVETKAGLRRQASDAIFGAEAIRAAFAGPAGLHATALGADGETQLLMTVTAVNEQPSDALSGNDQEIEQIARASGDDMLDQVVNQLQKSYGVSINQALAEQAMVR
ncbi:peptidylprolyl isomerase [Rhizobium sp. SSA_523]|uniref:peptidylprolyl isomerase n=1 Tax=Rhizobium sp. SSA_523 TaxID=2952477 RepID=UPI002090C49F|nr:peptidylprolyl isomerase [Rhizobium sp. SSA_523]MCO5733794.1 SurA N-terminal domain-containing protein [Rhizobium sp. SSA_523]WKC24931.1 SurA N-terminal domain-containing protein [Rhizobium sp. SSA_523]